MTATDGIVWVTAAEATKPPLDAELTGWDVRNRRSTHLNARRLHEGREYHLKWFFRRLGDLNPARREFESAIEVSRLGIPTVVAVGWGRHPRGTFFVMEGSPGGTFYDLPRRPERRDLDRIARDLGEVVARLHDARLCHRDLYVDHVLIDGGRIRLIDLGRVKWFRRRRWIIKDLGGLLFSAWREEVPESAARRFLSSYLAHTRRPWKRRRLLARVLRKARAYWRRNGAPPPTRKRGATSPGDRG